MGTKDVVSHDFNDALIEMKDSAIMLYMAGEYLCENFFLKKTGARIRENLDLLRDYVKELEKKLIGKPLEEFNLDEYFEPVADIAQFLQSPDDDIRNQ